MRRWITVSVALLASLAVAAAALADPGHESKSKGKSKKMSFVVTTTDNGSCGNPWATDVLQRTFTVKAKGDGTYQLTRRDRGTFTTLGAVSPGACDPTGKHGRTVRAGVTGKVVGYLRGTVSGGTFNPNATCTGSDCGFTDVFIATYFGASATFSCWTNSTDCKFNYNYAARKGQTLLYRHWQNKGKGAGTMLKEAFKGDIADA